jgi:hypothetical protein
MQSDLTALPHGFVADQDTSDRDHFLDDAQTQRKPEIQPDSLADHLSRKAVAGMRMTRRVHGPAYASSLSPLP